MNRTLLLTRGVWHRRLGVLAAALPMSAMLYGSGLVVATPAAAAPGSHALAAALTAPTVTAVSPSSGPVAGLANVEIDGTGFTGATEVDFDGTPGTNLTVDSDSEITVDAPAGGGLVDVRVTTPGGTSAISAGDEFTYLFPPDVGFLMPSSGPESGLAGVEIIGNTFFGGVTEVDFGNTPGTNLHVLTPTSLTVDAPAGSGTVDVTVIGPGGRSFINPGDEFTYVPAPSVTSVSPAAGPISGLNTVEVVGTGFTGATQVFFGPFLGGNLTVDSDTEITVDAPAGIGAGTVDVTVTTPGGTSADSAADEFSYLPVPTVTSVSPNSGPAAGLAGVVIDGTGFTDATAVHFGSTLGTSLTFVSDTELTVNAPAGTGIVDVTVTTPGGTSATGAADKFTYIPAPTVTTVSPNSGPAAGLAGVEIDGTGFTGVTGVKFGSTSGTNLTFVSDTKITVDAPAGAGIVDVTVTTPGGTSATGAADKFTYIAAPTVASVSPSAGPLGGLTNIEIDGTGFTGVTAVDFGGTPGTNRTVVSATKITVDAPAGTGIVDVTVTTPGGTSATSAADKFSYLPVPTVTTVSPSSGPAAGLAGVEVDGTGFTRATVVHFGAALGTSLTVVSDTEITVNAPAGTSTVDVTVTTPGGTSATSTADRFTYVPAPTVTAVSPNSGPAAGLAGVEIDGTGFTGATAVHFGAASGTSLTVVSDTKITVNAPAGTGTVDVTVTAPGGTSSTSAADHFTYPSTGGSGGGSGGGGSGGGGGGGGGGTSQTIVVTAPPTGTVGGTTTLTTTGGDSGNPVVLTVDPTSGPGVCTVSGSTVTFLAAGTCVIDANQAGGGSDRPAQQVVVSITVQSTGTPPSGATPPTVTFTATGTTGKKGPGTHGRHWYRSPVTVTFSCVRGSSALTKPCPGPITLDHSGLGQRITRAVTGADGGSTTITAGPFDIDLQKPHLHLTGAKNGHTYHGDQVRDVQCTASDGLSGVAGECSVQQHRDGDRVDVHVVVVDLAGNRRVRNLHYFLTGN